MSYPTIPTPERITEARNARDKQQKRAATRRARAERAGR